jgi:VWFA-related protein
MIKTAAWTAPLMAVLALIPNETISATSSDQDGPASTFRTGITQIDVALVVRDRQGACVKGLRAQDIEIYEDNTRQEIANLTHVDLPAISDARAAGVASQAVSMVLPTDRRVYLVVLDDLQIAPEFTEAARRAVTQFVQRNLAPTDVVGMVLTSGIKNGISDFTVDRKQLLGVVDALVGRKEAVVARREDPRAEYAAWKAGQEGEFLTSAPGEGLGSSTGGSAGMRGNAGSGFGQQSQKMDPNRMRGLADFQRKLMDPGQSSQDANAARAALVSMDMLRRLAEAMGRISLPRKSIVYFSQGLDYDVDDVTERSASNASSVREAMQAAISSATRNNVAFYAFDPRGGIVADVGYGAKQDNAHGRSIESLQRLASETGGFAAVQSNDLAAAYDRLVQENSQYYVVGYYPAKPKEDGKFHRIEVKIRGRSDLTVTARRGYFAVDGKRERKAQREQEKRERQARKQTSGTNGTNALVAANAAGPPLAQDLRDTQNSSSTTVAPPPPPSGGPEPEPAPAPPEGSTSEATPPPIPSTPLPAVAPSPLDTKADNTTVSAAMTSQLIDLLGSSASARGMPMRLTKVSFDKAGHKTAVWVSVSVDGGVPLRRRENRFTNFVATGLTAIDVKGRTTAMAQAVLNLNVSKEEAEAIRTTSTGWALQFEAEPGRYHVRVAAVESLEGQKGSLFFDVDVPSYDGDLTLNALVVRSQPTTRGLSSNAGRVDAHGVPMQSTATRVYARSDTLRASAEIYARKPRPTIVITKLLAADGAVIMEFTEAFAAEDFHDRVCHAYKTLPLASLEPGQYTLQYEAKPTDSAAPPITRQVPFTVTGQDTQVAARP